METAIAAEACANIAFIKYWGNRPGGENLPLNPSISMNLASCVTRTTVALARDIPADEIRIGDRAPAEKSLNRTIRFLDHVRHIAGRREHARVHSVNTFPTGCGIASSASGFAALAAAACAAYGLKPDSAELSRIARLGSGSAARSVPGGFVELRPGATHEQAFALQIASEAHWPDLRDVIVILSREEKPVSSAEGHELARASEMLAGRLAAVPARAEQVRQAIRRRDLALLGEASEADALSMHAVMMTSKPPLLYWSPRTVEVIRCVWRMRQRGVEAWFTIDAGPNVHVITPAKDAGSVEQCLKDELDCAVLVAGPGPGARILEKGVS